MLSWVRDGSGYDADRPVFCPLLGAEVRATIYTDGAGITPDQLDALSRFLAVPEVERSGLHGRLFEDYQVERDWRDESETPVIAGPEQVWGFVRWTVIIVPIQGPGGRRFVFVQGEPAWEEEHGVEMLFRDERLLRMGRASGLFLTRHFWSYE